MKIDDLIKTNESDASKKNSLGYDPNYEILKEITVEEVVFDKEISPNLICKKVDENRIELIQIGMEFEELYQMLGFCEEQGDLIIKHIHEKLNKKSISKPTVINLRKLIGDYLFVDKCYLIVYKPQYKDKYNNWVEEAGNVYLLDRILSLHEIDKNNPNVETGNNLPQYLKTAGLSYMYYKNLKKANISESEAREKAGLVDSLLFKIAYSVYKINHPPKQIMYDDMKDYVFKNIDDLLNEEEDTIVLDEKENLTTLDYLEDDTYEHILNGFLQEWEDSFRKSKIINEYNKKIKIYLESVDKDLKARVSYSLMTKTLKLILEYLETIGQYGD